jgi:hypothetical protein
MAQRALSMGRQSNDNRQIGQGAVEYNIVAPEMW